MNYKRPAVIYSRLRRRLSGFQETAACCGLIALRAFRGRQSRVESAARSALLRAKPGLPHFQVRESGINLISFKPAGPVTTTIRGWELSGVINALLITKQPDRWR